MGCPVQLLTKKMCIMTKRTEITKAASDLEQMLYFYVKEQLEENGDIDVPVRLISDDFRFYEAQRLFLSETGEPMVATDMEDLEFWGLDLQDMLLIFDNI